MGTVFFHKMEKLLVIASILKCSADNDHEDTRRGLTTSDEKKLLTDDACCLAKPKYFVSHANDYRLLLQREFLQNQLISFCGRNTASL